MSNISVDYDVLNQKQTPAFYASSLATRPTFGYPGRIFIDTDSPSSGIYRDTGSAWVQVADPGAGTTGTLQQVTTNGNTTTLPIQVQGIDISKGTGTGFENIGIGLASLQFNTTGEYNTSIGTSTLTNNRTGISNTAIGNISLFTNVGGNYNTGVGGYSLTGSLNASNNTAIGYDSMRLTTSGSSNTALGYQSGRAITTGSYNTILGNYIGTATLTSNIVLSDGVGNVRLFADANGLIAINQAVGSVPGGQLDIHTAQTYALVLNGLTTNNAYTAFSNNNVGKWRIGNTYNAGANTFDVYNLGTSSNALSINSTTNNVTLNGTIVGTTATFINSGSGIGVGITNSGSGDGLKITHSLGRALQIASSSSGYGIIINNDTASTSIPFTIQKSGAPVISMTDTGTATFTSSLTATQFILSGATSPSGLYYNAAANRVTIANYTASGIVRIETNGGVNALEIDSSQNSIFTGNLDAKIITANSTGSSQIFLKNTGGGSNRNWQFQTSETAAGDISLMQSTTAGGSAYATKLNISATGGMTIYTPTAGGGSALIVGRASGVSSIKANTDNGGNLILDSFNNSSSVYLNNYTSGSIVLGNGGGNTLIGTTTDSGYKLDCNGTGRFASTVTIGTSIATGTALGILNTTNSRQIQFGYSSSAGYNYIQVYDGSSFQPLMLNNSIYINSSFNVLIGTTTDDTVNKLQVTGSGIFSSSLKSQVYAPISTNVLTIPTNLTNYTILNYALSGLLIVRDNTNGGAGCYLLDPNNGALLISSNLVYVLTFTYSSPNWVVQKSTGSSVSISFNSIAGVL
jgi:hypothetical protein